MNTVCYLWNETRAKKGSCEVATGVLKFVTELDQQSKNVVHLFCDRCSGQSNNQTIVIMLCLCHCGLA